ncbi:hypothetical protein I8748_22865, partial [Nostoc sp. CENA67]|nr:hypothetical protein [Amazonocrinis nigriterrae CENA67]
MYKKTCQIGRAINKRSLIMTEQLTLFNTELFANYDESTEPPDPDEYPTIAAYESAHAAWERKYPHLVDEVHGMSEDEEDECECAVAPELWGDCDRTSAPELWGDGDRNSAPEQSQPGIRWYWDEVVFDEDLETAPEHTPLVREQFDTSDALYPYKSVREQVTHETLDTDFVREQKPVTQVAPEHTH